MRLEDYPTPLVDGEETEWHNALGVTRRTVPSSIARDLERKLNLCRDVLDNLTDYIAHEASVQIILETLELTK